MRERRSDRRLVGRERELARIHLLADDATVGAVLLSGPVGVGTSALADGALDGLADQGWNAVRLSATEATSRIAYGSLSSLLARTPDPTATAEPPTTELNELTVLRAVEAALALDGDRPVAVVIDDVAAIDRPGCELLVHLAANRRLFIIGSQGSDSGLDEALLRLTPAGVVELPVEPLGLAGTAELAAELLGGPAGPGLVRVLHHRSVGHALYARDMLDAASADGRVREVDGVFQLTGDLRLGPSLARQITLRFGLLSETEQTVLELVAVAGELGVGDLEELAGPTTLELMERRGLIATRTDGRRLRLTNNHPLHGDAVATNLTPLVRRRRHQQLAAIVERSGARRAEDRIVGTLARLDGGQTVSTDDLLDGVTESLRLDRIRQGARLAEAAAAQDSSERSNSALAEALIRQGRFVEADRLLAEPLPGTADEWDRLRRAIRRSSNQLWGFRDADRALRIDEDCAAALREPAAIDRVEAHKAWVEYCDGHPVAALERTEGLTGADHPDVRFAVAAVRAPALVICGRVDDAAELAERAWAGGWGADTEFGSRGQHLIALGFAKLYQGDVEAARFVTTEAIAHCRDSNETTALLFFLELAAHTELLIGDLPLARSYFDEALAIGAELAIGASVRSSLAGLTMASAQLGHTEEAERSWRQLERSATAPGPRGQAEVRAAGAWVRAVGGDQAGAADDLRSAAADTATRGLAVPELLLLLDLARLGHATDADATRARLVGQRAQGALLPAIGATVAALAGADAASLDTASTDLARLGFRLWSAESAAAAADAWSVAGHQRESTASQRRSDHERSHIPGARTPGLARARSVEPLTRREREIAAIGATGASNADIAERLHVSVRTVETHLHRIYRKLGIANRGELADAVAGPDPGG